MPNRLNPTPPDPSADVATLIARADAALDAALPPEADPPTELHRAMRYAVLGGGKRLRPLLVYAAGHAVNGRDDALDAPACAVELIHAYSLVHDDLPSMDDDDLRRGRPTCHIVFGEAMAILAGDALQALAFELLSRPRANDPLDAATRLRMLHALGHACGSTGMAGGQALDLSAVGATLDLGALQRMHAYKTGALIRVAVTLGALAAGCTDSDQLQALEHYGRAVGMAFQVRDDILDVEGTTEAIGKTAGKDAASDKPTFPSLLGLDTSRAHLQELTDSALEALDALPGDTRLLDWLARYAAGRNR